jgi:hypothetical protein
MWAASEAEAERDGLDPNSTAYWTAIAAWLRRNRTIANGHQERNDPLPAIRPIRKPGSGSRHAGKVAASDVPARLRLAAWPNKSVTGSAAGSLSGPDLAAANLYGHLTDEMLGRAAERTDTILGSRSASTA